jgi:hypothetical protein
VQFLGPEGSGKSTHLLTITARLGVARYVRLDRGDPIPEAPILVLDELQWLPKRERMRVFSRRCSFAIGSHLDLADELAQAGIETKTVRLQGMSLIQLREFVHRRIEHVRRRGGSVPTVDDPTLEQLIRRHRSNMRAIELDLYDAFQRLDRTDSPIVVS